jgi:hypothetical protein
MLSNHERRELARIERALREDPDWREPRGLTGRLPWWSRWGLRLLIGFAGLVIATGVVTGDPDLLLQGLLLMAGGGGWWVCRQVAAAKAQAPPADDHQPEH